MDPLTAPYFPIIYVRGYAMTPDVTRKFAGLPGSVSAVLTRRPVRCWVPIKECAMTFYSIISGILFLGACKAFLAVLGSWTMLPTALLALTILNEAVITSELIERKASPVTYSLGMKLLDFVTFVVLAWALLVVSPAKNAFDIDVSAALPGASSPRVFWLLLMTYWLLVLFWNHIAGQFASDRWRAWFKTWMRCMAIAPAAGLAADWRAADFDSASAVVVAANLVILAAYLASKLVATKKQAVT